MKNDSNPTGKKIEKNEERAKLVKVVCVQCHTQFENRLELDGGNTQLPYCVNPKCPNYGLFQIGEVLNEK